MLTKVASIQMEIDNKNAAIDQEAANGQQTNHEQIIQWRNEISVLQMQLSDAKAEEANQQHLQDRVEEAKQNGYLLDTLTASNGMTMAELSYSPENHELVCIAVQKAFLSQQDAFNAHMNTCEYELTQQTILSNDLNEHIQSFEIASLALEQEKKDAYQKLENATKIIAEKDTEIKRLQDQQVNPQAVEIATLSAEEQEAKLINEINGKQIKVYNVRPKDENAVTNTMFIANNAITGAEFEDYYLYLCKINEDKPKRYKEISEAEAEQLRADFESKKAEINASIPSIPNPQELKPLDMPEIPAVQEGHPKDTVQTAITGLADSASSIPGESVKAAEETPVTGKYNPFPQTGDHATDIQNLQMAHLDLIDQVNALKTSQDSTALTVAKIAEKANLPLSA